MSELDNSRTTQPTNGAPSSPDALGVGPTPDATTATPHLSPSQRRRPGTTGTGRQPGAADPPAPAPPAPPLRKGRRGLISVPLSLQRDRENFHQTLALLRETKKKLQAKVKVYSKLALAMEKLELYVQSMGVPKEAGSRKKSRRKKS